MRGRRLVTSSAMERLILPHKDRPRPRVQGPAQVEDSVSHTCPHAHTEEGQLQPEL